MQVMQKYAFSETVSGMENYAATAAKTTASRLHSEVRLKQADPWELLGFIFITCSIITKLEASNSQKNTKYKKFKYKVDTGTDGSLITLKIFKILFSKATLEQLAKMNTKRNTAHIQ